MGKILLRLQERLKRWIKPATSVLIDALSDLTRSRTDLVIENALLRQQLIILKRQLKRPQLTNPERFRLVFLSHFTKFWKQALHIVQPETLLRWHQNLFRMYWRQKSQGRPKVESETIVLIQKMANKNLLWGAERIHGELLKLGIEVSKRSIQKYMTKDRKAYCESNVGDLPEESSESYLGMRLYGSKRLVISTMVYLCGDGTENAEDSTYRSDKISNR
jgi:hypothetical protein